MAREMTLEMANLVCKFGKDNLIDYFEEIVVPAFFDKGLKRKYTDKTYFFEKVDIVTVEERVLLVGRIIKDEILEREQVYEYGKGLVADADELRSSPSSVFVLILDVHRLLYVKETKNAPSLESFKATLEKFLKIKHKDFINEEYEKRNILDKVTKKELMEEHPSPSLEIIPLTSAQGIEEFVKKYQVLREVKYKFSDRNDEHDNEGFFEAVQRQKDEVGSKATEVRHSNREGLDKNNVISEVQAATAQGTQRVTLAGTDGEGTKLRGNNESFQLKAVVQIASRLPRRMANVLYYKFRDLVENGLVKVGEPPRRTLEKLNSYKGDENG